jgi:hypothetical protein
VYHLLVDTRVAQSHESDIRHTPDRLSVHLLIGHIKGIVLEDPGDEGTLPETSCEAQCVFLTVDDLLSEVSGGTISEIVACRVGLKGDGSEE